MKALLIVGSILLFFIFLLSIRIRFCLDFSGELHINLRILCFRIQIHPKKLTPKRILKMQKKQEKKAAKPMPSPLVCCLESFRLFFRFFSLLLLIFFFLWS